MQTYHDFAYDGVEVALHFRLEEAYFKRRKADVLHCVVHKFDVPGLQENDAMPWSPYRFASSRLNTTLACGLYELQKHPVVYNTHKLALRIQIVRRQFLPSRTVLQRIPLDREIHSGEGGRVDNAGVAV